MGTGCPIFIDTKKETIKVSKRKRTLSYPTTRPKSLADVNKHHVTGKISRVNGLNMLWLRDALDLALDYIEWLETQQSASASYLRQAYHEEEE